MDEQDGRWWDGLQEEDRTFSDKAHPNDHANSWIFVCVCVCVCVCAHVTYIKHTDDETARGLPQLWADTEQHIACMWKIRLA